MHSGTGLASQAGHTHAPTGWKNFHKINRLYAGATRSSSRRCPLRYWPLPRRGLYCVDMTDLESYRQRLIGEHGMRELIFYEAQAQPPYFYQYEDDGSIYIHSRFIAQANAVVGIFSLDGEFIYGGTAMTTH